MASSILITGVSSGIGHALARTWLDRGETVYGLSRRRPEDMGKSSSFHFLPLDLGNTKAIPEALSSFIKPITHLDKVILNAGVLGRIADLKETSLEELKTLLEVNLWSNKVLLDQILQEGRPVAQVVAISSGAAVSAMRGWGGYSISKAALNMLVGLYAAECPGTHFCAFAPGIVDTPMQDQLSEQPKDSRFTSLESLRLAKGTPTMPKPEAVAEKLITAMDRALKHPSGAYLDLATLMKRW